MPSPGFRVRLANGAYATVAVIGDTASAVSSDVACRNCISCILIVRELGEHCSDDSRESCRSLRWFAGYL